MIKKVSGEPGLVRAVFVHLGESPCQHLWLNVERHKKIFPEVPVHLVVNSFKHLRNIPEGCEVLFLEKSHLNERLSQNRDVIFRRGFWSHTLARLFVLQHFHEKYSDSSVLHVESDVLLLPDFPWKELSEVNKLAWQQYNTERDVASLLYIPNLNLGKVFVELLEDELEIRPEHTDMTILKAIYLKNPELIGYLPIVSRKLPSLINVSFSNPESILKEDFSNRTLKEGVFDSAALGMWLLGHDPRNTYGKFLLHEMSPIRLGGTPIDPSAVYYQLSPDGRLKIHDKIDKKKKLSVWSLHIHSKERQLFSDNWLERLEMYVQLANNNPAPLKGWRFSSVLSMFVDSIWTRTPHKFFLGFPFVHRFRRLVVELRGRLLNGKFK